MTEENAATMKDSKFKQKFRQQRLAAWQPILTADTVLPAFFLIGLLFTPLGVALLWFSNNVMEKQIDYTNCTSTFDKTKTCQEMIADELFSGTCYCEIHFNLDKPFEKNVYMYYGLDNFYQNHRRYVKSRDDYQLIGKKVTDDVNFNCNPFNKEDGENGLIYAPCGAIANSLFNDSFILRDNGNSDRVVAVHKTGITWDSDKSRKFNNPPGSMDPKDKDDPTFAFYNTAKPKYWSKHVYELDLNISSNNGYENEDLIVWMRTAAFPSFRKLYRRIDHSKESYRNGLSDGNYTLEVTYNYPVMSFGGSKRFILSTTSFLGGKNNFLGIAYITVGAICLLMGVIFLVVHIKFGKRPADLQNITSNTPYYE